MKVRAHRNYYLLGPGFILHNISHQVSLENHDGGTIVCDECYEFTHAKTKSNLLCGSYPTAFLIKTDKSILLGLFPFKIAIKSPSMIAPP